MKIKQLQSEVAEWSNRNFPNNQPHQPLLGVGEEVGELMHAHLKMEQGIRGPADRLYVEKCDAVGDILIYLADYCERNKIDMEAAVDDAWAIVKRRDWTKDKINGTQD